jgi:hypothetical protein
VRIVVAGSHSTELIDSVFDIFENISPKGHQLFAGPGASHEIITISIFGRTRIVLVEYTYSKNE